MNVVVLPVNLIEKFSYWLFVIHFNQNVIVVVDGKRTLTQTLERVAETTRFADLNSVTD